MLAELTAVDDGRLDLAAVGGVDAKLDGAVGEQQPIAGLDAARQPLESRRNPARAARRVAGHNPQRLAGLQLNRPAAGERARADLGTGEILQNRHLASGARGGGADAMKGDGVRLAGSVGEIQAEDVHAGGDSASSEPSLSQAGPTVAMIFVRRMYNPFPLWGKSFQTPLSSTSRLSTIRPTTC